MQKLWHILTLIALILWGLPEALGQYNLGAFWRNPDVHRLMLQVDTTLSPGSTVTLPLSGVVDVRVNWGHTGANNTCQTVVTSPTLLSCTYPEEGTYTIRITGQLSHFGNGSGTYANADKIIRLENWGSLGLTSLSGAFRNAINLLEVEPPPSTVTNTSFMFQGASIFNQDIGHWDTQNIANMASMFQDASSFNQDLTCWNVLSIGSEPADFATGSALNSLSQPLWGSSGCPQPPLITPLFASAFDANVSGTVSSPGEALGPSDGNFTANANDSWTGRWQIQPLAGPLMTSGFQSLKIHLRRAGVASTHPRVTQVSLLNSDNSVLKTWDRSEEISQTSGTKFTWYGALDPNQSLQNLKVQIQTQRGVDFEPVPQTLHASSFHSNISGSVNNPDNALDASDGIFTTNTGNSPWTSRWNLSPITGMAGKDFIGGTHSITLRLRKNNSAGGTPTVNWVDLYQNEELVQRIRSTSFSVTSDVGMDLSMDFDGALLSGPSNLSIVISTTANGIDGNGRAVQLDSITWNATYFTPSGDYSAVQVDSIELQLGHE